MHLRANNNLIHIHHRLPRQTMRRCSAERHTTFRPTGPDALLPHPTRIARPVVLGKANPNSCLHPAHQPHHAGLERALPTVAKGDAGYISSRLRSKLPARRSNLSPSPPASHHTVRRRTNFDTNGTVGPRLGQTSHQYRRESRASEQLAMHQPLTLESVMSTV